MTDEQQESFPLDEALIGLLGEFKEVHQRLERQAMVLAAQREGALVLFMRQHGLKGDWQLAENGREIVKAVVPVPQE